MTDQVAFRLSLLENCHDSLNESLLKVEQAESEPRQWKFAVLHVVHAIELLLKERLHREHRLFIYENVDKQTRTVTLEGALGRLGSVGVSISHNDVSAIRTAIKWRNQITHHNVDIQLEEVRQNYLLLFEFLCSFHLSQIGTPLTAEFQSEHLEIAAGLMQSFSDEFVDFQGRHMHRSWPAKLLAAQQVPTVPFGDATVARIGWGLESVWREDHMKGYHPLELCRDCGCRLNELHGPLCCVEECPVCLGQFAYCDCEFGESPLWALINSEFDHD